MKFVSKFSPYTLGVIQGTQRAEVMSNGVTRYVENTPAFKARFTLKTLNHVEIEAARAQILNNGGPYAFGSIPGRDEGNINIDDAREEGYSSTAHAGYDAYQCLTTFDTEDPAQCPEVFREDVEQFMLSHYELGQAFVRVDDYNLSPPWPTYPTGSEVNVEGVVKFAVMGGFLHAALIYERSTLGRSDLIAGYEEAQAAEQLAKAEEAGLTATV